jgi:hypothetical protein
MNTGMQVHNQGRSMQHRYAVHRYAVWRYAGPQYAGTVHSYTVRKYRVHSRQVCRYAVVQCVSTQDTVHIIKYTLCRDFVRKYIAVCRYVVRKYTGM